MATNFDYQLDGLGFWITLTGSSPIVGGESDYAAQPFQILDNGEAIEFGEAQYTLM